MKRSSKSCYKRLLVKVPIKIPNVGESIVEASIGPILKTTGSFVKADEDLFEIETEKVNQVVYAPAAGTLYLTIAQGDRVKIGQEVGFIETSETKPSELPEKLPPKREQPKEAISQPSAPAPSGRETRKKMSSLRRVIAERLVQVKNQTAMLTTFNEADLSKVIALREKEQERFQKEEGVKLGFMSFFIHACVSALKAFPELNARIDGDEIVYHHYYDIGVAVGTEKGLMVPVIRNADQLNSGQIEKKLKEYAEKARGGAISIDDLQGGTFTITNGGVYGSMLSTPILNPPQSGILGMHNIVKRPVVIDDQIVIRPIMYLALSYDHRIVDGKGAISFLVHVKRFLEDEEGIKRLFLI